tara:strand:+ start:22791 stop:26024 length:3234 start_codon:yes stop_codon:yes gene_type:complete
MIKNEWFNWRCIGPFRGGRAVAVDGDPDDNLVFYQGSTGGVWKTIDGGITWENISDGYFKTSAVGSIHLSPANTKRIFVGMGECHVAWPRLHWNYRTDGIYRSDDSGVTWKHLGMEKLMYISKIKSDPRNQNIVYAGALGDLANSSDDRGIYKSINGGESWEKIHFVNNNAGVIDLAINNNNPDELYAAYWEVRRHYFETYSGGDHSSIYRSLDAGKTWTPIHTNKGFSSLPLGKISVSFADGRLWALVQSSEKGLYKSDDKGETWELVSIEDDLTGRPNYYIHVFGDPSNKNTVYVMNKNFMKSLDGGKTFSPVATPHDDHHDLWISPKDPNRIISGQDGGACITYDQGRTWSSIYNQPTGEFYHITTDNNLPFYNVLGTQQDNTAISVPSDSINGMIKYSDCKIVGSSESGHIAVDPLKQHCTYSGALGSYHGAGPLMLKHDKISGEVDMVTVWPDVTGHTNSERKYRFGWDQPIIFSLHHQNRLLTAANVIFESYDEGKSWTEISPDLTRNDPNYIETDSSGTTSDKPRNKWESAPKNKIAPFERCYISALGESPIDKNTLWAGTDDGTIQLTKDNSNNWLNVTPKDLEPWTPVWNIEPSEHDKKTAYFSASRYQHGDKKPIVFKTNDYGKTWEKIIKGIDPEDYARCIREDPVDPDILYLGTENGIYLSVNAGNNWVNINFDLPFVPIHDLRIKNNNLILGTQGRAFWILDDLSFIRNNKNLFLNENIKTNEELMHVQKSKSRLFMPQRVHSTYPVSTDTKKFAWALGIENVYYQYQNEEGNIKYKSLDAGQNTPTGLIIKYYLPNNPEKYNSIKITIKNSNEEIINEFSNKDDIGPQPDNTYKILCLRPKQGFNEFEWNLRYPGPVHVADDLIPENGELRRFSGQSSMSLEGPYVEPGDYTIELNTGEKTISANCKIIPGVYAKNDNDELIKQTKFLLTVRNKLSEVNSTINSIRKLKSELRKNKIIESDEKNFMLSELDDIDKKLASTAEIEEEQITVDQNSQGKRFGRVTDGAFYTDSYNARLNGLIDTAGNTESIHTKQSELVFEDLDTKINVLINKFKSISDNYENSL